VGIRNLIPVITLILPISSTQIQNRFLDFACSFLGLCFLSCQSRHPECIRRDGDNYDTNKFSNYRRLVTGYDNQSRDLSLVLYNII
jgi:hypothetical protein